MSKPNDEFWEFLGFGLMLLAVFGGFALIAWASGGK